MHGNAVASVWGGKVGLYIGFDVLSAGSILDIEQVEHKFSDGVGGGQVGSVDMCRVEGGYDLVTVALFGAELVGGPAEFEPVAEEMMDHVHAANSRDAGGRRS